MPAGQRVAADRAAARLRWSNTEAIGKSFQRHRVMSFNLARQLQAPTQRNWTSREKSRSTID